jgi:hypothetical protein
VNRLANESAIDKTPANIATMSSGSATASSRVARRLFGAEGSQARIVRTRVRRCTARVLRRLHASSMAYRWRNLDMGFAVGHLLRDPARALTSLGLWRRNVRYRTHGHVVDGYPSFDAAKPVPTRIAHRGFRVLAARLIELVNRLPDVDLI